MPTFYCRGHQEEKAKIEAQSEHQKYLKATGKAMTDRANLSRELRYGRNRGVVKIHDRLLRLHSKARGDERAQRMEALKACTMPLSYKRQAAVIDFACVIFSVSQWVLECLAE